MNVEGLKSDAASCPPAPSSRPDTKSGPPCDSRHVQTCVASSPILYCDRLCVNGNVEQGAF